MRIRRVGRLVAALTALLSTAGCLSPVRTSSSDEIAGAAADRRALAKETISQWSDASAQTARLLMEEYGIPDEVHSARLVWLNNGPWRRTVVRDVRSSYGEGDELGMIEQAIDANLTPGQALDVAAFDPRVRFDPRSEELSASSDREALNILRLNLARDVAGRRMTGEEARMSYARIVEFEAAGKTSPYLLSLAPAPLSNP